MMEFLTYKQETKTTENVKQQVSLYRVYEFFKPYRWKLLGSIILIFIGAGAGLAMPFLLRNIIDDALPHANMQLLVTLVIAMVLVTLVSAVINMIQTIISTKIGQSVLHDLRVKLYSHLHSLSLNFFTDTRGGEIQSRITQDIGSLQELVSNTAHESAKNLSVVIMTVIAMFLLDWKLSLFSLTVVPLTLLLSNWVGALREKVADQQRQKLADLSSEISETLSVPGIILSRTMGKSGFLIRKFSKTSKDVADLEVKSHTSNEWQWQIIYLLLTILPALTLLLGGLRTQGGNHVSIGTLMALIALQEQLTFPLQELLRTSIEVRKTRVLFSRIFEYLDIPSQVRKLSGAVVLNKKRIKGDITLENVSFSYDGGAQLLSDITIDIPGGSHVAIVGATGSGKTTVGYLIAGLYDVDGGAIYIDGIDIRKLSSHSLTGILGVVSQDPYLLNGTIKENLLFANPRATDLELITAAKITKLHDFIMSLPMQYETPIGEHGYRFSGGEKQRLSLTRTLLRQPAVIIMDEATSALDTITESNLSRALNASMQNVTMITIAHRLSTVRHADQIVVMDRGRIVEKGTHQQLLEKNSYYAKLLESDRTE
ncbi:ABC transporter ATP-binding protein/permease [Chryseobacterium rhizoplanae]|uniref:ABC transporter ATP-binding protein n=1 Tax=Chryseobacterium rhizoplanae TaxID=1609531 RepID=UPI001CE27025|nr:ABC transporter ATP-binding protein [Chryseobacterium rhizoplanae]UCA60457.1 ABC transporter ATP-binding protein/permease [Chryseobacterium rhizoplanae]